MHNAGHPDLVSGAHDSSSQSHPAAVVIGELAIGENADMSATTGDIAEFLE